MGRRGLSPQSERDWRERVMAKRNIRMRHRRSRTPDVPRRPTNLFQSTKTTPDKTEDTKGTKDDLNPKEAKPGSSKIVVGSKPAEMKIEGLKCDETKSSKCDKCGQLLPKEKKMK